LPIASRDAYKTSLQLSVQVEMAERLTNVSNVALALHQAFLRLNENMLEYVIICGVLFFTLTTMVAKHVVTKTSQTTTNSPTVEGESDIAESVKTALIQLNLPESLYKLNAAAGSILHSSFAHRFATDLIAGNDGNVDVDGNSSLPKGGAEPCENDDNDDTYGDPLMYEKKSPV